MKSPTFDSEIEMPQESPGLTRREFLAFGLDAEWHAISSGTVSYQRSPDDREFG